MTSGAVGEDNRVTVKSLAEGSEYYPGQIRAVTMLGSDQKLEWKRGDGGLMIQLPAKKPSEFAYVLKVTK